MIKTTVTVHIIITQFTHIINGNEDYLFNNDYFRVM